MNHEYQTPKTAEELRRAQGFSADGKELEIVMHDEDEPFWVCSECDGGKELRHGGNIKHGLCPDHKAEALRKMREEFGIKTE